MLRASLFGAVVVLGAAVSTATGGIKEARHLSKTGKYAEAQEAYEALRKETPAADAKALAKVVIGLADCLASQGETEKAIGALRGLLESRKEDPDLLAHLADLEFDRGHWDDAEKAARAALKADADHLLARWVVARLDQGRGEAKRANDTYKWFIDYHNAHRKAVADDADALVLIGQAAERYYRNTARGGELKETLLDVINELYEGAAKADPDCWEAPWLEGRLYLSGYNERDANRELTRAVEINAQAPEILVTQGQADVQNYKLAAARKKAEEALAINPHYAPAFVLQADVAISDERFDDALAAARKAVAEDPKDEESLARLAAAYRLLVDPVGASAVEAVALAVNPKPATFFAALGERLADRRKYHSAERAFLLAIDADPEGAAARIGLGMLYMQIGREAEARSLFDAAFEADPFNVRANNMIEVLKHMAGYAAIKSDHYSVLAFAGQDELLGKYMSRYLESIHGELTSRFGFSPPGLTQIEVMKDHKWFSARTIALPFIPTVGACTGKVVALASTRSMPKPFNWSRVLRHELTHVITLQQTDFNIPHWFTEALAVESENAPRPQEWNKLLLERVPKHRDLLTLDTINLGFIRPKDPDQRQLAYCQAQLYAQYMVKRFGPTALPKMLAAYRRGLTTDKAIPDCFGVDKADFEAKYAAFLDDVVKTIRARVNDEEPIKFSQLERQVKAKPDDPDLNARMAYEFFARRDYREARPFADKALKLKPKHPLASYVKARLFEHIGDADAALEVLQPALDRDKPDERVLDFLAELEMKAGRLDEAESLYELGRKDDPLSTRWLAGLARVHLRKKQADKFRADLIKIAENEADSLEVRQTLAKSFLDAKNFEQAERWATDCLYIQVYDANIHALLGDALLGQKKYAGAAEELQTALELRVRKPDDVKVRLARAQAGMGKRDDARATLDAILKRDPDHPAAKALREELFGKPADAKEAKE
ncbi:MAG TPA: tetratricopeptide repeat protein [Isosphaeraceae bacterium]|jgi:Tfp pilus assembly protein PilF|nr:tetratricopeptide repeat protein [Isosphaeraceae bacterium]